MPAPTASRTAIARQGKRCLPRHKVTNPREVLAAVQMAMRGGLTCEQVRDTPITHATMGEGLNLLFDTVGQQLPS